MPARINPTARQARLGAELRKMRERAGMTAREAATLVGSNPMQISHMEAGRSGVSEERTRRLASVYACDDTALIDALVAMAVERAKGGWWEEFRDLLTPGFLDLAELEHHATFTRAYQIAHIPGTLQTEDTVRAIFDFAAPALSGRELEARVQHRIRRRTIIERGSGSHEALLHEAALRMRFGGRGVARAQLEHILEQSHRPNVSVRVIPFEAEGFAGSGASVLYAGGPVAQLDTAHLDGAHGTLFLDAEFQLKKYRALLDRMQGMSLAEDESRDFIRRIAQDT